MSREVERAIWAAVTAVLLLLVGVLGYGGWHPDPLSCEGYGTASKAVLFCQSYLQPESVTALLIEPGEIDGSWNRKYWQRLTASSDPYIIGGEK